jgi:chromosomal replication initiation ATPase DnaA
VGGGLLRSVGGWAELKEFRDLGIRMKGDERLLGSSEFVEKVLKQANEQLEEKYRLQVSVIRLQELVEKVACYYKIDPKNLKSASKERPITKARRVLCYIAVRKLGYKCSDVSKAMGISGATVSKSVSLGSEISEIDKVQKQMLGH